MITVLTTDIPASIMNKRSVSCSVCKKYTAYNVYKEFSTTIVPPTVCSCCGAKLLNAEKLIYNETVKEAYHFE